MIMKEYDEIIKKLRALLKEHLYVEDEQLYIRCGCKYDFVTLMYNEDKKFTKELFDEIEYKGEI